MNHVVAAIVLSGIIAQFAFAEPPAQRDIKEVAISDGIKLCYQERGKGPPLVFIHGTTEDLSVWQREIAAFSNDFRVISYSRRYNYPNANKLRPNHSAKVEANDLAALIRRLDLPKAHLVGHSYGAYTALFLAVTEPDLVATMTLSEPPLLTWLEGSPGPDSDRRKVVWQEFQNRCIKPAREALRHGNHEVGLRRFVDGQSGKEGTFDRLPRIVRQRCLRNKLEVEALMTSPEAYPVLDRERVSELNIPTLMLSGEGSPERLQLSDEELKRLLPAHLTRHVIVPNATHLMWVQQSEVCERALRSFLSGVSDH